MTGPAAQGSASRAQSESFPRGGIQLVWQLIGKYGEINHETHERTEKRIEATGSAGDFYCFVPFVCFVVESIFQKPSFHVRQAELPLTGQARVNTLE
jgi:hypothetical protein